MIHSIYGKTFITSGTVVNSESRLNQYLNELKSEVQHIAGKDSKFFLNEDKILHIRNNGKEYPLSFSALVNLCKILKLPTRFINKTSSDELTEKIINECPLKKDGKWNLVAYYNHETEQSFVAGIREGEYVSSSEFLNIVNGSGLLSRNDLTPTQYTHSVDMTGIYCLSSEIFHYKQDFKFEYRIGLCFLFSETTDNGFVAYPYYEVKVENALNETLTFDFVSKKPLVKISGKANVFVSELQKFLGEFDLGGLSSEFSNIVHLLRASLEADQINYFLLKKARSAARKPYSQKMLGDAFKDIDSEIIPEYGEFRVERRDDLKELPSFMANNLNNNFYFPLYYHRIFNFPATVEYPDSFFLSKQSVYSILLQLGESVNIGNIS